jgi:hypothetical protein
MKIYPFFFEFRGKCFFIWRFLQEVLRKMSENISCIALEKGVWSSFEIAAAK